MSWLLLFLFSLQVHFFHLEFLGGFVGGFFPPDTIFHRSGDASSVFLIVCYVASLAYGEMAGIKQLINVLKVTLPPT